MFSFATWRSACPSKIPLHQALRIKSVSAPCRSQLRSETSLFRRDLTTGNSSESREFSKPPMNNDTTRGPIRVPGLGFAVDFEHDSDPDWQRNAFMSYPHGFSSWKEWRTTVKELAMLQLVNGITDKLDWQRKVLDPEIMQKWKSEAMNLPEGHFTERTWQYCAEELVRKAELFEKQKFVKVLDTTQAVAKADHQWIDSVLQRKLKELVRPLLDQPEDVKDWHPGSDGKVLNLVHPSMYPFIYGKSQVVSDTSLGLADCFKTSFARQILPVSDAAEISDDLGREEYPSGRRELWSTRFQWLPCDIKFISQEPEKAKIVSYINGLHPEKQRHLYAVIEEYIDKVLPLWNSILSHSGGLRIFQTDFDNDKEYPPLPYSMLEGWDEADPRTRRNMKQKVEEYLAQPDNPRYYHIPGRTPLDDINVDAMGVNWETAKEVEIESIVYEVLSEKHCRIRKYPQPEPDDRAFFDNWHSKLRPRPPNTSIEKSPDGLQVIVKLSSIELTPEKPMYEGGNWHLEGKLNEHIVATAIYYYDIENVTPSHIRFRKEAFLDDYDMNYDHSDHGFLHDIYGVENMNAGSDTPAVQDIGNVATKNGRLLVFPNTLQHKVEPFELEDPSKPGHRRFLVLWLVDPNYRILSTRNVQPQQEDWWKEKLVEQGTLASDQSGDIAVSIESITGVKTMNKREAEDVRLELMRERTKVMESVEQNFETYNFCEH